MRNPLKNDVGNRVGGMGAEGRGPGWGAGLQGGPQAGARGGGVGGVFGGGGSRAARVPCSCGGQAGRLAGGRRRARSGAVSRLRDGLSKGHGRLSEPRRRWRRRGSARLRPIELRLRLRTRDQNSLGGADAAAAGFSGKAARAAPDLTPPGRGPRWRRSLPVGPGPGRAGGSRCPTFRAETAASASGCLSGA